MPVQAVALGAALQAGVLEGSVTDVMVMDVWQAALMRALAKRQLREDSEAARQVLGEEVAEDVDDETEESFPDDEEEESAE